MNLIFFYNKVYIYKTIPFSLGALYVVRTVEVTAVVGVVVVVAVVGVVGRAKSQHMHWVREVEMRVQEV